MRQLPEREIWQLVGYRNKINLRIFLALHLRLSANAVMPFKSSRCVCEPSCLQ